MTYACSYASNRALFSIIDNCLRIHACMYMHEPNISLFPVSLECAWCIYTYPWCIHDTEFLSMCLWWMHTCTWMFMYIYISMYIFTISFKSMVAGWGQELARRNLRENYGDGKKEEREEGQRWQPRWEQAYKWDDTATPCNILQHHVRICAWLSSGDLHTSRTIRGYFGQQEPPISVPPLPTTPSLHPPPCLLPNSSSLFVSFHLPTLVLVHAHIHMSAVKCRGSFAKALPTCLFCKCDLTSDGAHQLLPTHTGTQSNAEQRIATHCNTLQHVPLRFPSLSFHNVSPVSLRFLDFWDKLHTHRMPAKHIVGLSSMQAINNLWIHTHTHKHTHTQRTGQLRLESSIKRQVSFVQKPFMYRVFLKKETCCLIESSSAWSKLALLYTYTHTHTRPHTNTHAHTHAHRNTQKHTHKHTHTHTHT